MNKDALVEETAEEATPPAHFTYSPWRHGGWYVNEVRYPSGACGCVSRNYADGKWRIACDSRPFEERPTFSTRHEAAVAEFEMAKEEARSSALKEAEAAAAKSVRAARSLERQR